MKDNPLIPEVVLTDFLIFNKPVAIDRNDSPLTKHISLCDEIKLGSDHSVFSIEYAALNYFAPNKNQYAFILEGFEKEWNFVGNQRLATYTNLDAGKYIFRVKAANSDGIWSTQDRSVPIIIFPAWWGTSWAYILYLLIAVTLYYMFWRFHLNRTRMKQELILEQQHAEKLEVLNRMKSRFFANIAHEFRTPLTLINGPIRQLIADGPDINFKDKCKMILHNSEKLNHLINQLLELNKLEAGYIPLKARKTDIILIINKINMSFTSLFESKKINFNFTVSDDIIKSLQPPEVYIDPDKFEKIISNLLSNAIKFTPDEGRIEIILKKYADVASNSDRVSNTELMEIIVRDSGPGIPEENIKRIFDRFYQVDNFRSSGYVGTGIGLSLAKELVELHHGTINVESVEGQGTAFIVRLQTGKKHLKPDEIEVSAAEINDQNDLVNSEFIKTQQNNKFANSENGKKSATKNSPLVLIIEDNQEILSYLSDYLGNRYQIIKAASGDEGVNMAVTHIPDLIISDVMMPNTDGYELCDMIKNDERTSHIPVILLTARSSAESRIKGLETGADDYIGKPFDIKELEARVQNLIDQRQQLLKKYNRKAGLKLHEITVTSSDKKFLEKALAVIEKNIGDPGFGVEEFADEMALSRVQLYRKIRALTGQNASTFIRTVRINRAAELLKKKYDNIGQIAFYVGFNSPSYFSKCFYKQFGIYPSNYSS
jgi:signal transduction histidine kinase/DNA-binding NarL/FixJ family response regulator